MSLPFTHYLWSDGHETPNDELLELNFSVILSYVHGVKTLIHPACIVQQLHWLNLSKWRLQMGSFDFFHFLICYIQK